MRLAFDAKRAFLNKTGLGNYSRNVVAALCTQNSADEMILCTPHITDLVSVKDFYVQEPESEFEKLFPSIWRSWTVLKQMENLKVDLFHGLSNELPFGIGKSFIRSVVTIHDLIFMRYPTYYSLVDRVIYRYKVKRACAEADSIVATSQQTKTDLMQFLSVPESKIQVVYQSCDYQFKQRVADDEQNKVKTKYGLPSEYILSVGTIEKRKNLLAVIHALAQLPKVNLVVVGRKTNYFNEVSERIAKHDLTERVHFLHEVEFSDLPAIYQMAQLLIYPSEFEGFGIPILEGMYSQIPVITTKGGCFEEVGGPAAKYVEYGNIEVLSNTIAEVLSSPELRAAMVEKGIAQASKFTNEQQAQQLYSIYQKALVG
jgi:glycosyltransferase involved in cell wall biosynthesis